MTAFANVQAPLPAIVLQGLGRRYADVVALDDLTVRPGRPGIGDLLPVTHGIRLLQDLMLRGATTELWRLTALAVIALVTPATTWVLLRRGLSARA